MKRLESKSGSGSEQLFDVESVYSRSLRSARVERGEPPDGVLRMTWELKRWGTQKHLSPIQLGYAAFAISAISGTLYYFLLRGSPPPLRQKGLHLDEDAA